MPTLYMNQDGSLGGKTRTVVVGFCTKRATSERASDRQEGGNNKSEGGSVQHLAVGKRESTTNSDGMLLLMPLWPRIIIGHNHRRPTSKVRRLDDYALERKARQAVRQAKSVFDSSQSLFGKTTFQVFWLSSCRTNTGLCSNKKTSYREKQSHQYVIRRLCRSTCHASTRLIVW
jgi:hypothetical protein